MQRRRAPGGQGQPLSLVADDVAQMLPHQRRRMQIMMLDQQLIKSGLLVDWSLTYRTDKCSKTKYAVPSGKADETWILV